MQALWTDIEKHTLEKGQINATNVIMQLLVQTFWKRIWKRTVEKVKQMQPMPICMLSCRLFEDTYMKKHSGEKPNKCDQFDYASSYASALKTHLKMHSGEKQNKCNQCDFTSFQAGNLRKHMKKHSGEKWNNPQIYAILGDIWKDTMKKNRPSWRLIGYMTSHCPHQYIFLACCDWQTTQPERY